MGIEKPGFDFAQPAGFFENLWVTTKYFCKKPGFFGWMPKFGLTRQAKCLDRGVGNKMVLF